MMAPTRGLLLDFYGTVVEEDDAAISRIVREIVDDIGADASSGAAIGYEWSRSFSRLCAEAHDETFRPQRALELESLQQVLSLASSTLDAEQLSSGIFTYWQRPASFDDGARLLNDPVRLPVCVVSNIDRVDLESAISHHGFAVDHIVTSEDARAYKPRPEMFAAALDALHLCRDEVVHVGDSLSSDVRGAEAAGIRSVWINRSRRSIPDGMHPWAVVSSLDELREILAE